MGRRHHKTHSSWNSPGQRKEGSHGRNWVQSEDEMDSWPSGATPGTGLTTTQLNTTQHNSTQLILAQVLNRGKKKRRKKMNKLMKAINIKSNNNMISHNLRPKVFSLLYFSLFSISVKSVRNAEVLF